MTDPRQEDREQTVGQPILANRVGRCAVNPPVCQDLIQVGDEIVEVLGNWVHDGCVEAMEVQLVEQDQGRAA
jgi:hypothetical protein